MMRGAMLPDVEFISLAAGRAIGDGLRFGLDCGAALFGLGTDGLGQGIDQMTEGHPFSLFEKWPFLGRC